MKKKELKTRVKFLESDIEALKNGTRPLLGIDGAEVIHVEWLGIEILFIPDRDTYNAFLYENVLQNATDISVTEVDNGLAYSIERNGLIYFVMAVFRNSYRILFHEALHMAHLIMDNKGIPTDVSNTEVLAYLQGDIASQAGRFIGLPIENIEEKGVEDAC